VFISAFTHVFVLHFDAASRFRLHRISARQVGVTSVFIRG
jgi:hypothetical protein